MDEKIMIGLETHVQLNIATKMFCGCKLNVLGRQQGGEQSFSALKFFLCTLVKFVCDLQ